MTPQAGPGSELEAAREKLGVSRREVSDALNLPMRVIEALETDDFERLPPTVFTRGYLRSYARLLELDPAAVLARYPLPEPEPEAEQPETPAQPGLRKGVILVVAGIVVAIALIVILVGFLSSGREETTPEPRVEASPSEPQSIAGVPTPPVRESGSADSPTSVGPAEVAEDIVAAEAETPALLAPAPEESSSVDLAPQAEPIDVSDRAEPSPVDTAAAAPAAEVESPALETGESRRITEIGDDVISFAFTEDCWVEVKTLEGESLYSDLNRAGAALDLVGRGPFRVLLGYAPGVLLSFNGETVALGRHTRNNVATVVLGR